VSPHRIGDVMTARKRSLFVEVDASTDSCKLPSKEITTPRVTSASSRNVRTGRGVAVGALGVCNTRRLPPGDAVLGVSVVWSPVVDEPLKGVSVWPFLGGRCCLSDEPHPEVSPGAAASVVTHARNRLATNAARAARRIHNTKQGHTRPRSPLCTFEERRCGFER
jgi:hypothetical protein